MGAAKENGSGTPEIKVTTELVPAELRTGTWPVFAKYQEHRFNGERRRDDAYVESADDTDDSYVVYESKSLAAGEKTYHYRPLVDEPGLFFRFAGLWDGTVLRSAWRDWIAELGVLGLDGGKPRGGVQESYHNFAREVKEAHTVLRLFEAAVNPRGAGETKIREILHPEKLEASLGTVAARDAALRVVGIRVQKKLNNECFPQLYQNADGTFVLSYGFQSLLGALYIQMASLLADGAAAARWCQAPDCFRFIPPGSRRDKKFCDKSCLMRHRRSVGKA